MQYFVQAKDGSKFGPANLDLLNRWIEEKRIAPGTKLIEEGTERVVIAFALAGLTFPGEKALGAIAVKPREVHTFRPAPNYATSPVMPRANSAEYFRPLPVNSLVESHLVKNCIHIALGFLPITLLALYWSSKTEENNKKGDYAEADRCSRLAYQYGNYSFVAFFLLIMALLIVPQLVALSGWVPAH